MNRKSFFATLLAAPVALAAAGLQTPHRGPQGPKGEPPASKFNFTVGPGEAVAVIYRYTPSGLDIEFKRFN